MKTIILMLLMVAFQSWAQIPNSAIDEINLRVEHQYNPSIVVGVYTDGEFSYHAKGWQHVEKQIPTSTKTVYEIGSITKTFTGLLLAQMVTDKKLMLNDAVQDYWTKPFTKTLELADRENQTITFKQLATHTSGLPRLPSNLDAFSKDPYAEYDREKLLAAVNQLQVNQAGTKYAYSNFGAGFLGETLAAIENSTYNDLIVDNILQPLGLKQTYMQLDQVPTELLAQGYSGNKSVDAWQFKALAAAGSIRSSIEDLLSYGVTHLEGHKLNKQSLSAAMQLATTEHFNQGNIKVGLGWHLNADGIIWHNGGTAGFSSIIMINPQQNKVVAAITNSSPNNSIEDIAVHLMDERKPMIDHEFPVEITDEQLSQFTGSYNHPASDKTVTFILKDSQLYFTAPKQPRQSMVFIGDDTFKLGTFKVKFHFQRDENQNITGFELDGWGGQQTYNKIVD